MVVSFARSEALLRCRVPGTGVRLATRDEWDAINRVRTGFRWDHSPGMNGTRSIRAIQGPYGRQRTI
jgi:hypothetical protein